MSDLSSVMCEIAAVQAQPFQTATPADPGPTAPPAGGSEYGDHLRSVVDHAETGPVGHRRAIDAPHSLSEVRALAFRIQRRWLEMLGDKVDPPPYSPERRTAWRAGYEDALRDLATLRAAGREI